MGWLADLGRSNIGEQAIRLQNQAIAMRQQQQVFQQQQFENRLARETFEMNKALKDVQMEGEREATALAKYQRSALQKQEEELDAPFVITDQLTNPISGPVTQKQLTGLGLVEKRGSEWVTTQRKLIRYGNILKFQANLRAESYEGYLTGLASENEILRNAITEEQSKPKPNQDYLNNLTGKLKANLAAMQEIYRIQGKDTKAMTPQAIGAGGLYVPETGETIAPPMGEEKKLQAKTRTFVDPSSQKVVTEEYDYDPTQGTRKVVNRYEYPVGTMIAGYDPEGNPILVSTKGPLQTIKPSQETGPLLPSKVVQSLKEEQASIENAIHNVNQIKALVGQSASTIGFVGAAQRFIDSVSSQLMSVANIRGGKASVKGKLGPDSDLFNPELYDFKEFAPEAVKSAQIKSLLVKLAYSLARSAFGQEGRGMSDLDVQNSLNYIGANSGSPAQLHGVLDIVAQNLSYEFSTRYRIITGREFPGFTTTPGVKITETEVRKQLESKGISPEKIEVEIKGYKERGIIE